MESIPRILNGEYCVKFVKGVEFVLDQIEKYESGPAFIDSFSEGILRIVEQILSYLRVKENLFNEKQRKMLYDFIKVYVLNLKEVCY